MTNHTHNSTTSAKAPESADVERPCVHARFRLLEDGRITCYQAQENGALKTVQGLRVKLLPVQGEPFGSATPGGSLEMNIVNTAAQAVFKHAEIGQEFDLIISPASSQHEEATHA